MTFFDILILAIALSIDAMVVSFANGLMYREKRLKRSIAIAFTVGTFQFGMPIIGYYFAQIITEYVKPYSHWLVFGIFVILGIKFIKDSFEKNTDKEPKFKKRYLFAVGIATSIDALFAGISISFSGNMILIPSVIIGLITFINSLIGFWSTNLLKKLSEKILEIFGGIILILLGFKVLFTAIL